MDKQAVVHSSDGMLLPCNSKEWTTHISTDMDASQQHHVFRTDTHRKTFCMISLILSSRRDTTNLGW